jgi:hypothetical protein
MLKDATNSSSCKDPNALQSHVMHTTNSGIKASIPHYVPSLITSGGPHLLMMLDGTSSRVTNVKSAKRQRSGFHPPSLHQHPFSVRCTLTPCSCPTPEASDTSSKLDACSPHGQSGMHFKPRPDAHLVHSSSKKSCADGEPSRRS